ncbi:hypothetical protein [Coleofasciculus sp. FACHB-SPT9]|uniref:hypothetical protein n=1 Tax=Cyanophyceae TaxID=3028117 RepID=UPI00322012E3
MIPQYLIPKAKNGIDWISGGTTRLRLRWLLKFKGICKSLGQDIHVGLEQAIANWIEKQQQQEDSPLSETSVVVTASTAPPSVPTIASLIEETLRNRDWVLRKLVADAEIAVERINELLKGDRASDSELQKLA